MFNVLPYLDRHDSTSLQFVILSDPASSFPECNIRDIFEVIVKTEIFKRFDTSQPFWKKCDAFKPKKQKKIGLYEIEHIDDPCCYISSNPKEYFEFFKDYSTNKKNKEIKKGSNGIDFQNYANRIKCLKNLKRSADLWLKKEKW